MSNQPPKVAQHLPLDKGFVGIGANGHFLKQTTGDSGSGAQLGSFEEVTAGVGPVLSYARQFGKTVFVAEGKWLPLIRPFVDGCRTRS